MTEHPEGPESAAIEALRNELLGILIKKIGDGMAPGDAATAAVAAGTMIYGSLMGGIRQGAEAQAVQTFGTWVVDNIIAMNQEGWPSGIELPGPPV